MIGTQSGSSGGGIRVSVTADRRFGTNSYLVEDTTTHDAVVIDANLEPGQIVELVREHEVKVRAVALTHTDIDHIAGLQELLAAFGPIPVAVHQAERRVVEQGTPLRKEFGEVAFRVANVQELIDGEPFRAGSLTFKVLHTPGHSPGGVTLAIGGCLFTGDALFAGSIGRSDFANSDPEALLNGIQTKLLTEPDERTVYSGHGPATTIGKERRTNPFLR